MKNRRQHDRIKKRLHVEFGEEEFDQSAIATDISLGGIYLQARRQYPLGTFIHLHIVQPDGVAFYAEGEVVRLRKTDPRLARVAPAGMGIRFRTPEEIVRSMVPRESRHLETHPLQIASREDLMKLMAEQLANGMLLARVDPPPPGQNAVVEFALELEFKSPVLEIQGSGRVVQQLMIGKHDHVVIELANRAELLNEIDEALK